MVSLPVSGTISPLKSPTRKASRKDKLSHIKKILGNQAWGKLYGLNSAIEETSFDKK